MISERLDDEPAQAATLSNIGIIRHVEGRHAEALSVARGRYAEALSWYERALQIAERLGLPQRDGIRGLRDEAQKRVR